MIKTNKMKKKKHLVMKENLFKIKIHLIMN